jgi:uncharacterized membrane protein YkvA (DUF1232 family)
MGKDFEEPGMSDAFTRPFTKAEIEAIRQATRDEAGVRRDFWAKLKGVARQVPFAEDIAAAYFCTLDPSTPSRVRFVLLGAIAYFVLPFDAVADFLPLLGFADDAAIIAAAISQVAGAITQEHRDKARDALREV